MRTTICNVENLICLQDPSPHSVRGRDLIFPTPAGTALNHMVLVVDRRMPSPCKDIHIFVSCTSFPLVKGTLQMALMILKWSFP